MIFFLHGTDTYRSRQKLNDIKDKFRKEVDPSALNLNIIDGAKADMDAINRAAMSMPFLAKRRLLVIENIFANKNEEILAGLTEFISKHEERPRENDCIMVFWDAIDAPPKKVNGALPLWDLLAKQKFSLTFIPLEDAALSAWVTEEFRRYNVMPDLQATEYLIARTGNDTWLLKNEIHKLAAYAASQAVPSVSGQNTAVQNTAGQRAVAQNIVGQDNSPAVNQSQAQPTITPASIDLLVIAQIDDNIFALVDAIGNGQKAQALKLLNDQIENGANEMYLCSMINRCFRILTLVRLTPPGLQAKLGLNAFVLKKSLAQSARYTPEALKRIYGRLLKLDEQIKTGVGTPALLLNWFIAAL